ncbi:hypothetical protein H4219_004770 [Mycoemilia scoparia]|uniref:Uncharacterized protein n=1 Tax=Mycoemilia scoparia TaxID=417184 RepID=A0A9W7ZQH2_9FUNG|nr:hypothetical protein H4219_004770 [Mycoemilia scoparia]
MKFHKADVYREGMDYDVVLGYWHQVRLVRYRIESLDFFEDGDTFVGEVYNGLDIHPLFYRLENEFSKQFNGIAIKIGGKFTTEAGRNALTHLRRTMIKKEDFELCFYGSKGYGTGVEKCTMKLKYLDQANYSGMQMYDDSGYHDKHPAPSLNNSNMAWDC